MLSIVVPTYNEGENVFLIARQIREILASVPYELIFVDDSTDDTVERLAHLADIDPHVRYEHRVGDRGLGTAVVLGFQLARGRVLTVMDADLQHPPEMLPKMLAAIAGGADIVIPSRFIPGGDDGGLNLFRKIVSATARYLGKIALKSLRPISDPTGGFFMFRQSVIATVELRPIG
jgi:dolichol-phosphate mannosyltransferase